MKTVSSVQILFPTLHFKQPFKIAYEEVTKIHVVTVKLTDTKGNEGLGSASPDEEVTKENVKEVYNVLKTKLTPDFFTLPLQHIYAYHERIATTFAGYPSAQMAVEEAVLRLYCTQNNISLVSLFGGYRDTCETLMTIGIKDTAQTIKEIKYWAKQGFKLIKLKCGINAKEDIKKILEIYPSLSTN
ncbi:MAG: hypothetical protein KGJ07_07250, partial [Patescibacteria group bacterium]|nr:hypothetical protein [Patescibacteria group bacterium]